MALSVTHTFVSAIADDAAALAAGEVCPQAHWNAVHTITGTASPAGATTQVQFNDAGTLAGDAGLTYNKTTDVLSLNGSANSLSLAGSATGSPVTLTASGSDTNIPAKYVAKGLGFHQFGPDTYAVSGWGGVWVGLECLILASPATVAQGGYFEINGKEIAAGSVIAVSTNANTPGNLSGGNVNFAAVYGQESVANSYLTAGHTLDAASGLRATAYNVRGGTTTLAIGLDAKCSALAGAMTSAIAGRFKVTDDGGTGTITTGYGVKVEDVTVASTNYSCFFGAGKYHFDALTASNFVTSDGTKNLVSKTNTQATALLDVFVADSGAGGVKGLAPATVAGDATKFLRGDATWQTIPGGGDALTSNPLSQFAATTSLQLKGVISDETGSGALVFATSPTLVTPILGTPTSGTLTNCTLPVGGVTGLGTGVGTFLATPSSANLASAVTDETGSGALVFATSPTLVTPLLGTPTSGTLTNCTGLPIAGLVASTSTAIGVGTIELGAASDTTIARSGAGAITVEGVQVILSGAALGTPASGTLTNCTALPVAGITASTSTALGVGSLELGHATDTTLTRASAGVLAVEGVNVETTATLANTKIAVISFVIDGGGSAITTGVKGDLEIPFACTINRATLLADQSGSIVVDIWKDTYANYPPTVADTITASAKPTITTATKSQDATLTGWTTSITAGDTLRFNVDSITTCTRVLVSLKVTKT